MTIGELARRSGVNVETVRYYERRGLLARPPRTPSGYRVYGDDDWRRLEFIRRAQGFGFTLREIGELLDAGGTSFTAVSTRAEARLHEVDEEIARLTDQRERLARLAGWCAEGLDGCLTLDGDEEER